jgi:uncharacterized protein YbaR (Trm112 family)
MNARLGIDIDADRTPFISPQEKERQWYAMKERERRIREQREQENQASYQGQQREWGRQRQEEWEAGAPLRASEDTEKRMQLAQSEAHRRIGGLTDEELGGAEYGGFETPGGGTEEITPMETEAIRGRRERESAKALQEEQRRGMIESRKTQEGLRRSSEERAKKDQEIQESQLEAQGMPEEALPEAAKRPGFKGQAAAQEAQKRQKGVTEKSAEAKAKAETRSAARREKMWAHAKSAASSAHAQASAEYPKPSDDEVFMDPNIVEKRNTKVQARMDELVPYHMELLASPATRRFLKTLRSTRNPEAAMSRIRSDPERARAELGLEDEDIDIIDRILEGTPKKTAPPPTGGQPVRMRESAQLKKGQSAMRVPEE